MAESPAASKFDEQTTVSPKWSISESSSAPAAVNMPTDTKLDKPDDCTASRPAQDSFDASDATSHQSSGPLTAQHDDNAEDELLSASALPNPEAPPLAPAPAPQSASTKIDDVIAAMHRAGDMGQRVAVIGCARYVGTTLTAIALTRRLARDARVALVDLAFASASTDESSEDESLGIADLVRGEASFSDIIIRDPGSPAHLITVGRVKNDVQELLSSQVLWDAVHALAQGYDYLVIDAGAQADTAPHMVAGTAPYAVLVCGDTPVSAIGGLTGQLQRAGFAHLTIMSGAPPALEEASAQSAA
jgi:Mrp family chromosome partitioning ATPase